MFSNRQYGSKQQSQKAKRAAATSFAVMSDKTKQEKAAILVSTYGFKTEQDAIEFINGLG